MMPRSLLVAALLVGLSVTDARADRRGDAKAQVAFGIRAAQADLWREARYRFERAIEIDPTYAAAYNNLAIAHEQAGEIDQACAAYTKALELEPKNSFIAYNHDLFKELHDRRTNRGSGPTSRWSPSNRGAGAQRWSNDSFRERAVSHANGDAGIGGG